MIKKIYPQIFKIILGSEFRKNVIILMTGKSIAYALPVIVVPILTRIFTPEDFGIFALYSAIVATLAVLSNAGYENAIVLPKKKYDAYQIVILSFKISILVSLLIFFLILFFADFIEKLYPNQLVSKFLYLIPLGVFLVGIYQTLYYWFNRDKGYKTISNAEISKSSTMVISQVIFGLFTKFSSFGLILGQIIGQIFGTLYLFKRFFEETKGLFVSDKKNQNRLAVRYINFPKFILAANIMNASSRQMPNVLFNLLFNSFIAGFYHIVNLAIGVPVTVFSNTIGDVFRQKASKVYLQKGECLKEVKSIFKKLIVISFFPFLILIIFAPEIFEIIFGKNWQVAGEFAQILAPMYLLKFITNPISNMFIIAEKQKLELLLQTILFLSICFSFFIGFALQNITLTILLISIFNSSIYIIMAMMSFKLAKGYN